MQPLLDDLGDTVVGILHGFDYMDIVNDCLSSIPVIVVNLNPSRSDKTDSSHLAVYIDPVAHRNLLCVVTKFPDGDHSDFTGIFFTKGHIRCKLDCAPFINYGFCQHFVHTL